VTEITGLVLRKRMRRRCIKASYRQAEGQFGAKIDLENTPTINEYVAPN
jgi:hypothetical protein